MKHVAWTIKYHKQLACAQTYAPNLSAKLKDETHPNSVLMQSLSLLSNGYEEYEGAPEQVIRVLDR